MNGPPPPNDDAGGTPPRDRPPIDESEQISFLMHELHRQNGIVNVDFFQLAREHAREHGQPSPAGHDPNSQPTVSSWFGPLADAGFSGAEAAAAQRGPADSAGAPGTAQHEPQTARATPDQFSTQANMQDPQANTQVNIQPDTQANTQPDTQPDTQANAQPSTQGPQPDTQPDTQPGPQWGPQWGPQPGPQSTGEPRRAAQPDLGSRSSFWGSRRAQGGGFGFNPFSTEGAGTDEGPGHIAGFLRRIFDRRERSSDPPSDMRHSDRGEPPAEAPPGPPPGPPPQGTRGDDHRFDTSRFPAFPHRTVYFISIREDELASKASDRALESLRRVPLAEIPVDERMCTICYEPLTEYHAKPGPEAREPAEASQDGPLEAHAMDPLADGATFHIAPPAAAPAAPRRATRAESAESGEPAAADPGVAASGHTRDHARDHASDAASDHAHDHAREKQEEEEEEDHSALALPQCKHIFGASCLRAWLKTASSCPLCRTRLESEADAQHLRFPRFTRRMPFFVGRDANAAFPPDSTSASGEDSAEASPTATRYGTPAGEPQAEPRSETAGEPSSDSGTFSDFEREMGAMLSNLPGNVHSVVHSETSENRNLALVHLIEAILQHASNGGDGSDEGAQQFGSPFIRQLIRLPHMQGPSLAELRRMQSDAMHEALERSGMRAGAGEARQPGARAPTRPENMAAPDGTPVEPASEPPLASLPPATFTFHIQPMGDEPLFAEPPQSESAQAGAAPAGASQTEDAQAEGAQPSDGQRREREPEDHDMDAEPEAESREFDAIPDSDPGAGEEPYRSGPTRRRAPRRHPYSRN